MKRTAIGAAAAICLFLMFSSAAPALEIDMGVGIGAPPVKYAKPPELQPIPGRYAYFVPDIDIDLFFYHGLWYRPFKGRWFSSENYTGPWENIHKAPPALSDLPRHYRIPRRGYSRIPYIEVRKNWERWENERHWDKRGEYGEPGKHERDREKRHGLPERGRDRY